MRTAWAYRLCVRPKLAACASGLGLPPVQAAWACRLCTRPGSASYACNLGFPPVCEAWACRLCTRPGSVACVQGLGLLPLRATWVCSLCAWPSSMSTGVAFQGIRYIKPIGHLIPPQISHSCLASLGSSHRCKATLRPSPCRSPA